MNILIVEDSKTLAQSIRDGLTRLGYAVDVVDNGNDGLDYASFKAYDVIILDLMLPGMDGLTLLKKLRARGRDAHVLILSAMDQVDDRVNGLQIGADDYMVKPFSFDELCARVSTLIRRRYQTKSPEIKIGGITVNMALRKVNCGKETIALTPGEYSIIEFLLHNRGRVVSVEQLLDAVHDSDAVPARNVITVMICNIRKKLSKACKTELIKTSRGYGYYID
jgi:DNA-binding response OmpR family regulator